MTKAKKIVSRCESCVNYVFDEDCECYCCMVDLDEDEAYRSIATANIAVLITGLMMNMLL